MSSGLGVFEKRAPKNTRVPPGSARPSRRSFRKHWLVGRTDPGGMHSFSFLSSLLRRSLFQSHFISMQSNWLECINNLSPILSPQAKEEPSEPTSILSFLQQSNIEINIDSNQTPSPVFLTPVHRLQFQVRKELD